MKNAALSSLLLLFCLLPSACLAQENPLNISLSVFNGAVNMSTVNPDEPQDFAIRVVVDMTNLTPKKVKVLSINCTFFDGEGHELARDQVPGLEIRGREQKNAILFYPNLGRLFAFKAIGAIVYEHGGQSFTFPIEVDNSQVNPGYSPKVYRP